MDNRHNKKYRNAVLYFIKHCNNKYLGDTKLNKLLYYLDFVNYRDRGTSVTGDVYYHHSFGPVTRKAREIVSLLAGEYAIERDAVLLDGDGHKIRYRLNSEPAMSIFTKSERELLDTICGKFKRWETKKIVTQTNLEAPWFYSSPGERVKYRLAADIDII